MTPQPWLLLPQVEPSPALRAAVGGHPLIAQLLAQRAIDTPEQALPFLDPTAYAPAPPSALVGLARAASTLFDAIRQERNIFVWGDFDVDGQTSTTLLVAALQDLAAPQRIRFHVPNRFSEGHGIRRGKLDEILADPSFQPHLLLTCDTGIAEAEGIGRAKDAGLTVVVTDHHDLPAEFADAELGAEPPCGEPADRAGVHSVRRADAIVNPKFLRADDPLRTLPGVGVAYKLVQQLYELSGDPDGAAQFLDLVALGIVADVAEQVHDTRYLLQLGLERLRRTQRVGLKALMHNARLTPDNVVAESIGFQIGPRMNALGRLDDATVAVELLTTDDAIRAGQLAAQMERLNNERRLLTSQIAQTAFDMLERRPDLLDFNAIVLANPNWHAGIVGIVASRLVEEYHLPTVLLCSPPGEPARGSARSTPGVDIGAAIAACADLLLLHGGHPGAAGLTLDAANIDRFRRELSRQVDQNRIDAGPDGLRIDAELPFSDLSLSLVEQIERLAPFGNGNPAPTFMSRRLTVVGDQRIGRDGAHRRLVLQDEQEQKQGMVWWRSADVDLPSGAVDIAYTLSINDYRGKRTPQLTFRAARPAEQARVQSIAAVGAASADSPAAQAALHDLRRTSVLNVPLLEKGAKVAMTDLPAFDAAFWYAEGTRLGDLPFRSRLDAADAAAGCPLVLWSSPPSPELLHWLVETLAPSALYLIGKDTAEAQLDGVLKQVAGMAKKSLNAPLLERGAVALNAPLLERDAVALNAPPLETGAHGMGLDGLLPIDRLAARIGVTEEIIRCSLLWLEQKGLLRVKEWGRGTVLNAPLLERGAVSNTPLLERGDVARVEPGDGLERNRTERLLIQAKLDELLAEMRAYRRFFQRAQVKALGISLTDGDV